MQHTKTNNLAAGGSIKLNVKIKKKKTNEYTTKQKISI